MSETTTGRLSFGGILDRSFQLLRAHFVPLVGSFTAASVPLAIGSKRWGEMAEALAADPTGASGALSGAHWAAAGLPMLLSMLLLTLVQLAANVIIADDYRGRSTTLAGAQQRANGLYIPYAGTVLLQCLFVFGWSLLLLFPGLYFSVCWLLLGPVATMEGKFGLRALKRSRQLMRGAWGRGFGLVVVLPAVLWSVRAAVDLVVGSIPVVGTLVGSAVLGANYAFTAVALMVFYVDQRSRKEDFDLELMAEQVEGGATPVVSTSA